MSTHPDFHPIGEHASSTTSLGLAYEEQGWLIYEMRRAAEAIGSVPGLHPDQTDVSLRGIRLKPRATSTGSEKATMGLDYSETNLGLKSAAINIGYSQSSNSMRLDLEPTMNIWAEWHPGNDEATRYLTNSQLIRNLSTLVPDERIFEPLLDRVDLEGMEIAHLLADHLKKSATARKRNIRVDTDSYIVGDDFLGRAETSLSIKEANQRRVHSLSIRAIYDLDPVKIRKEYSYIVNSTAPTGSVKSATGNVIFSSDDGVPRSRLEAFAKIDQDRNDPLKSLHRGLTDLRKRYDVSKRKLN